MITNRGSCRHRSDLQIPLQTLHFCHISFNTVSIYSSHSRRPARPMHTVVPLPNTDSTQIVCPRFLQMRLHKYNPIPLAFCSYLPLSPVNPFSKMRGKSSFAIPTPVSEIQSVISSFIRMVTLPPSGVYFSALDSTCSNTKSNHFSSVSTRAEIGNNCKEIFRRIKEDA